MIFYIFNKKTNKLVDSKYSFDAMLNNNTIELTIKEKNSDTTKLINTLESVVSKKYANINYFDGKLYFYRYS